MLLFYTVQKSYWKTVRRLYALFKRIIKLFLVYFLFHVSRKNFELFINDNVWAISKGHRVRFNLYYHKSYLLHFFIFLLFRKIYKTTDCYRKQTQAICWLQQLESGWIQSRKREFKKKATFIYVLKNVLDNRKDIMIL